MIDEAVLRYITMFLKNLKFRKRVAVLINKVRWKYFLRAYDDVNGRILTVWFKQERGIVSSIPGYAPGNDLVQLRFIVYKNQPIILIGDFNGRV